MEVETVPFLSILYEKSKQNNLLTGILLFDIISFIAFIIDPAFIVYPGDLDILFGGIVGVFFALKFRHPDQSFIPTGVISGVFGGILAAISITIYTFIVFVWPVSGFTIELVFNLLATYTIIAALIGITLGILFGFYYSVKDKRRNIEYG